MKANCQVDFYVLSQAEQSSAHLACHLALKAWEEGYRVMLHVADENEAQTLDECMWEFPAGRFLPHARSAPDLETPVSIGLHGTEIPSGRDVLINLSDQPVSDVGSLRRLLEIVPGTESKRLASRQKFRAYRDMGLDATTHHL